MTIDSHVIAYAVAASLVVLISYAVMSVFMEFARSVHKKMVDEEKRKKEAERNERKAS